MGGYSGEVNIIINTTENAKNVLIMWIVGEYLTDESCSLLCKVKFCLSPGTTTVIFESFK